MHNSSVSLGGVAVGAALLVAFALRWWFKEGHKPVKAIPYLLSVAYGMLLILSGGGLLGVLAGWALWGSNGLGDMSLVYGVGGTTMNVTRARQLILTPGGHVIVLLISVALFCLWKWAKGKVPHYKIAWGAMTGVSLALSGTLAGAAAVPLGSAVNFAGSAFTGVFV